MKKPPKELSVQPPMEGVTYKLSATYLSNIDEGKPHPEIVELYLFIDRTDPKSDRHFVWTLSAPTEIEALALLKEFASRPDVQLVAEKTGKVVAKEWLDQEQTASGPGPIPSGQRSETKS